MALTQVTSIGLKDGEIVNADLHSAASVALSKLADSGALGSAVTATTQSASDDSTKLATTAFVQAAVTSLIDGAPGSLNTLNELAAAINDDSSYATTLTTALATKLPLAGGTLTGALTVNGNITLGTGNASYIYMRDSDDGTRTIHCNSDRIGFLKADGNWGAYCADDGTFTCENNLVVNGGNSSYITMGDADEGSRIIHNNGNNIGFLKADGNWGVRCADDGKWDCLNGVNVTGGVDITGILSVYKTGTNTKLLLSRNESVGTDNTAIGVIDFANNTAHTVNARIMAKTSGTGNVGGQLVIETRDPSNSTLDERLRIKDDGKVLIRSQGATASDGYAALEIRQNTGGKHLVLASNSATSSTNEVMLGFKLHPSGQDERVKAAIICRGTGANDYGQPSFMSFCLDGVGDNGISSVAPGDEKIRINSTGQYTGSVDIKGIPGHLRLYNIRQTSDWDAEDPIGKLDFYVGDDASNNLPYNAGFIHCINSHLDNQNEPGGHLIFGSCYNNQSGGAVETMRLSHDPSYTDKAHLQTQGIGAIRDVYDMMNINPAGTGFDHKTNNDDGGATYWEIQDSRTIRLYSTSGGHGGEWGKPVLIRQDGWYYWRMCVRVTTTCGSIHGSTPTSKYKYPIGFYFNMGTSGNANACTGRIWNEFATTGTCNGNQSGTGSLADGTKVTKTGIPTYLTKGIYQPQYHANGYQGVRELNIYSLELVQCGAKTHGYENNGTY